MDGLDKKLDFIDRYRKASNAASGSDVDANANVVSKNIATMSAEIPKADFIELNRGIVKKYLKKVYGEETGSDLGKQFEADLKHHICYSHDETTIMPYTYGSKEVINVKYKGKLLLLSFDKLYSLVTEPETLLDEEKVVYGKFPTDLEIMDRNGWTKVTRIVKKKRHRDLVRVKTGFGEDLIVTDNHPLIISDDVEDTIDAINAEDKQQYKRKSKLIWNTHNEFDIADICDKTKIIERYKNMAMISNGYGCKIYSVPNKIKMTEELGYFVGFFIGDGYFLKDTDKSINIIQKDRGVLRNLAEIVIKYFNAITNIRPHGDCFDLCVYSPLLYDFLHSFLQIGDYAQNILLPYNILETNPNFAKGIIWGLVDSDGHVGKDGYSIDIRVSSRACVCQLAWLLKDFGYSVGMAIQEVPVGFDAQRESGYNTNYTIWSITAGIRNNKQISQYSFKKDCLVVKDKNYKYTDGWVNITNIQTVKEGRFLEELNEYIYDITTESHSFYCNNLWVHNCIAISLYPFLINGLRPLGGTSCAPKHADSYIGGLTNLVFLIAGQFAGAVAIPETIPYLDHFLRLDYGDDYIKHLDDTVEAFGNRKYTLRKKIEDLFQQFIYCVNQPAAARGYQSPFTNISYYDEGYFNSIFGDFVFPDGDEPNWESTKALQKMFMKWFNAERLKEVITFPVETMNLLYDKETKEFKDSDMADFTAEMWSEGHSFFLYNSDSADSLSSCCFSKDTIVLARSCSCGNSKIYFDTFENIGKTNDGPDRMYFEVFHNGSWCRARKIKLPNRPMFKITTANNKTIIVSDNHLNPCLRGDVRTDSLTTDDYLMFNSRALESYPEQDLHLTYEQGFCVGAFLGDGSFGSEHNGKISEINFSQNEKKYAKCIDMVNTAIRQLGGTHFCTLSEIYNNVYPIRVASQELADFIIRWTNWERGTYCFNKELNMGVLLQSKQFRQGILDGWYNTDGGNSNRCYTTSKKLVECMEALITSLGMNSIINIDDRGGNTMTIRGVEYQKNYPLYCVRWYDSKNKRSMANVYKIINNSIYFKISSIEPVEYSDDIYCFEMKNEDEPYFTLPNGIITHNCRLKSGIEQNTFSYTLGAGGLRTGSKKVITINLNRISQDWDKTDKEIPLEEYIGNIVERVHKYLIAWNTYLKDLFDSNLLSVYKAGYISLEDQYLTVGINGGVEAAEYFGIKPRPENPEYQQFMDKILTKIKSLNTRDRTADVKFNTEFTPCENASAKLYKWDKRDGYVVPEARNLYNSYFFPVEDKTYSVLDKIKLHGDKFIHNLDGGSACHINLEEHLTKEQYRKIMNIAAKLGCSYYTFNVPNTICNECGHISKHHMDHCEECGSTNLDYATRVIGYLKRISNFSEVRQVEAAKRYYNTEGVNNEDDN